MPKGWSRPVAKLLDLRGLAIGADAAKNEDDAGAGVGQEEIAIGRGHDEARHGECAAAWGHHFLVVGALHGRGVAARIERDLESGGRERPCVGGARNHVGSVVDGLGGVGLGQVGERDLAANAGLLLVPIGEGSLAGDDCGAGRGVEPQRAGCSKGSEARVQATSREFRKAD